MEANIEAKVEQYLELLNQIKVKVNDEQTAVNILKEISKDRRMEEIRQEKEEKNNEQASKKQLAYLKQLKVDTSDYPSLTKAQASELIDEALDE